MLLLSSATRIFATERLRRYSACAHCSKRKPAKRVRCLIPLEHWQRMASIATGTLCVASQYCTLAVEPASGRKKQQGCDLVCRTRVEIRMSPEKAWALPGNDLFQSLLLLAAGLLLIVLIIATAGLAVDWAPLCHRVGLRSIGRLARTGRPIGFRGGICGSGRSCCRVCFRVGSGCSGRRLSSRRVALRR